MPSNNTVKNDILKKYNSKFWEVVDEFKSIKYFCSTNDGGSSRDNWSFTNINVHYVNEDFEVKQKLVGIVETEGEKTADNYRNTIDKQLDLLGIR